MMYCQTDYMYQTPADFQGYAHAIPYQGGHTGIPPYQQQNDASMYSPTTPDRPSPSFRIEEILSQKGGSPAYGGMYANNSGHYPQFPNGPPGLPHGYMLEKEYQGINGNSLYPAYFRLKSNIRTPGGRKCRKPRTVFSELQLMVLEREFTERKYLSTPQRTKLAERLGLNQTQVKTWYQNRRMKWKKETNETDTKKLKQMSVQSEEDDQEEDDDIEEQQLHHQNNNNNNNNNNSTTIKTNMLTHNHQQHNHHQHHQHHLQHHNLHNTHPSLDTNFLLGQHLQPTQTTM